MRVHNDSVRVPSLDTCPLILNEQVCSTMMLRSYMCCIFHYYFPVYIEICRPHLQYSYTVKHCWNGQKYTVKVLTVGEQSKGWMARTLVLSPQDVLSLLTTSICVLWFILRIKLHWISVIICSVHTKQTHFSSGFCDATNSNIYEHENCRPNSTKSLCFAIMDCSSVCS